MEKEKDVISSREVNAGKWRPQRKDREQFVYALVL